VAKQLAALKRIYETFSDTDNNRHAPETNSQRKRRAAMHLAETQPAVPYDGQPLPSEADGWSLSRPTSDELFTGVSCIRFTDGSFAKYYRTSVKQHVLQARAKQAERESAKKATQEALQREAEQKEINRSAKKQRAKLRRKLRQLDQSYFKAVTTHYRVMLLERINDV
jgi:hypothetical protein